MRIYLTLYIVQLGASYKLNTKTKTVFGIETFQTRTTKVNTRHPFCVNIASIFIFLRYVKEHIKRLHMKRVFVRFHNVV